MEFKPLEITDCDLLYKWFHSPSVKQWFMVDACDQDNFIKKHQEKINAIDEWYYIVYFNNIPFGYICYYNANIDSDNIGFIEPVGTYGIELFIGNTDFIGKGFGKQMLLLFIETIIKKNKNIKRLIIDPHINNKIAYNMYLTIGFKPIKEYDNINYGKLIIMEMNI